MERRDFFGALVLAAVPVAAGAAEPTAALNGVFQGARGHVHWVTTRLARPDAFINLGRQYRLSVGYRQLDGSICLVYCEVR